MVLIGQCFVQPKRNKKKTPMPLSSSWAVFVRLAALPFSHYCFAARLVELWLVAASPRPGKHQGGSVFVKGKKKKKGY